MDDSARDGSRQEAGALALLNDDELRRWAREHAAQCEELLGRDVRTMSCSDDPVAAAFGTALLLLTPDRLRADVFLAASAWDAVPADRRRALALEYPAVVGPLNGAGFAERVGANRLLAAGLLRRLERQASAVPGPKPLWRRISWQPMESARRFVWGMRVGEQVAGVQRQLDGFRWAVQSPDAPGLLHASTEADGRFVAVSGEVGPGTRTVAVFVPGTLTYGNHLSMNMSRLSNIDGRSEAPGSAVGVYWQGIEFPRFITDNANARYNQDARERLSAFDAALDVECARHVAGRVMQTYIGHSYGASAIGSAESTAEGLTLDRMVYAGAPGTGFRVDVPQDTVNPDAERYALIAPVDWKPLVGGLLYGRAMGGDPIREMGAQLLETGFLEHAARRGRLLKHNDYLLGGSTAALNIRAVVLGRRTLPAVLRRPWPWGRMSDRRLRRRIDGLGWPK